MYDLFEWIWEHRNQPLTIWTILGFLAYVIDKLGRKMITHQIKRLFHVQDHAEFKQYVRNQARIEAKLDAIMQAEGIRWNAGSPTGELDTPTSKSLLQLAVGAPVLTIVSIIRRMAISRSKRRKTMTPSKINWVTLVPAVMGGVKLILQSFGIDVITDDLIDQVANIAASVAVVIGIIASHKKTDPLDKINIPVQSEQ